MESSRTAGFQSYHISGGSGQDHFRIDSSTGNLSFTGNYDFNDPNLNSTLTLDITIRNGSARNSKKIVKIKVVNVNNPPEVTSDLVTLLVNKASQVGTVIGYIEARDLDKGENGKLNYEVVGSTLPKDTFHVIIIIIMIIIIYSLMCHLFVKAHNPLTPPPQKKKKNHNKNSRAARQANNNTQHVLEH